MTRTTHPLDKNTPWTLNELKTLTQLLNDLSSKSGLEPAIGMTDEGTAYGAVMGADGLPVFELIKQTEEVLVIFHKQRREVRCRTISEAASELSGETPTTTTTRAA